MKTKKIMMLGFALVLGLGISMAQADIETGLIGYYPFDGDADDYAGNNNGTIVDDPDVTLANGVPTYDADVKYPDFGESIRIPATGHDDWHSAADDYVDLGPAPEHDAVHIGEGNWTIAAWFKVDGIGGERGGTIFSNGGDDGPGIRTVLNISESGDNNGRVGLTCDDQTGDGADKRQIWAPEDVRDNTWHHVVGLRRGNLLMVFLDGVFKDQTDVSDENGYDLSGTTQANSYVGCGYSMDTAKPWGQHKQCNDVDLLIDEVKLYNRALTDADVLELYNDSSGSAGNKRPSYTVPDEQVVIGAPAVIQLTVPVSDDGLPLPTNPGSPNPNDPNKLRWVLTAESWPTTSSGVAFSGNPASGEAFTYEDSPNPPGTVFTCDPTVTLDVPGLYVFKFSADDGEKDSNSLFQVKVFPTGYEGLILHYSFDGMSKGDPTVEDIAVDPFTFDTDTGLPVRYDHDGIVMTPLADPNIVQGPENDGTPPDVVLLEANKDFFEAMHFDPTREQWVSCENESSIIARADPNLPIRGGVPRTFMCWALTEATNNAGLWDMGSYLDGQNFSLRTLADNGGWPNLNWRVQCWGYPTYDFDVAFDSDARWVHFALVSHGSLIELIADGKLLHSQAITINTSSERALRLAMWQENYFDGVIDDFRVYNRALSAQEVIDVAGIGNLAPEASAGEDLRLVEDVGGTSINIPGVAGTASPPSAWWTDVPGNVSIQWAQASGPGTAVINNATTISPTMDFAGQPYGLYVFTLTVSDGIDPVNMPDAVDTMVILWQEKSSYDLMGHWKLDESVGATAFDSSGNDLDGTLVGDPNLPVWQSAGGKVNGALQFINSGEDVDQAVDLSVVPGTDDITIMFWMNADSESKGKPIDKLPDGTSGTGFTIYKRDGTARRIQFRIGSDDNHTNVAANPVYVPGEWVHVACTFDSASTTGKLFINGLRAAQNTSVAHTINNLATPLYFGMTSNTADPTARFQGLLDHVRIYGRALSELEVARQAVADSLEIDGCQLSIPGVPMATDLDDNCYVDIRDLKILLGSWLICTDLNNPNCN
jgi:Concanavalin A-like lectin/glucanases superfamily